ncbi:MAG TPA: NDP-sugar synthase, partial [Vicinamibacteria bacterium]|nr:NDP-sugar synthase [Vicinamibacteria bacterium]
YWIDIGTPEKYLQVHRDVLHGRFPVRLDGRAGPEGGIVHEQARLAEGARVTGPFYVGPRCLVEAGAWLGPGTCLAADVVVRAGAEVEDSVLWSGSEVQAGARVQGALVGPGVRIGRHARVGPGALLGEGAILPDYSRTG